MSHRRFTSIALGEIICCKTFDVVTQNCATGPKYVRLQNIRTMCEAFNKTPVTKTLLGEVHKLLRMYWTLPVASATSERTFSAPRRLKNYLRSTMIEAGPPEQLPTDTLSQINYGHTRHCKDCKEFCLCQRTTQRAFWKI